MDILRFFLVPGHGLSNSVNGAFDRGAVYGQHTEHAIVSKIANDVFDRFYYLSDPSVLLTPHCSLACVSSHPFARKADGSVRRDELGNAIRSVHRKYTIKYLNETAGEQDAALFLHMNSAEALASGVEVLYSDDTPKATRDLRKRQAEAMARAISEVLGIPNRGAKPDGKSNRGDLDVLDDTDAIAFLIEFGFINNEGDVSVVQECGADALVAAMKAVRKVK